MSEDKVTQFATTEDLAQRVKIKLKQVHKRIDSVEESRSSTDTATTSSNGLMSAADKTKLISIEDSAQVNVIESVKVNGTALTPSSKAVNIDLSNYVAKDGSKVLSTNDFTTAEKNKLANVAENAQVNVIESVKVNGTALTPSSKAVNIDLSNYVTNSELDRKTKNTVKRYGYRIKKSEADPYARVEYILDAVGMVPAHMDFTSGRFNYGSWADAWFITGNKPCMLKSDGTVDYYLNPNDYSLKEDGTASDVANTDYDGNAMAQIPLCWVYRYEDATYLYEIVCPVQYDENYKAYAHTDANGLIKDYFYFALFESYNQSSKMRSLSGLTLGDSPTNTEIFNYSKANGTNWNAETWSQRQLICTLLTLIGKSTNSQAVFGNGHVGDSTGAFLVPGVLANKGQFFGYNSNNQQVKTFHIEGFWGNMAEMVVGLLAYNYKIYAKMTPENGGYSIDDVTGYTQVGDLVISGLNRYNFGTISNVTCNQYGLIPTACVSTESKYFSDLYLITNDSNTKVAICSGSYGNGPNQPGFYFIGFYSQPSGSDGLTRISYV